VKRPPALLAALAAACAAALLAVAAGDAPAAAPALFGLPEAAARMGERLAAAGPWEARLRVDIQLPGLKVRGKRVELEFTPPDRVELKAKGFALLPRRTLLLSPDSLFLGLSDPVLDFPGDSLGPASLRVRGVYREGAALARQEARIDTTRWLLTHLTASVDSLPAMRLVNRWQEAAPGVWLPLETVVELELSEKLDAFYERLKQPMRRRRERPAGPGEIRLSYEQVELEND